MAKIRTWETGKDFSLRRLEKRSVGEPEGEGTGGFKKGFLGVRRKSSCLKPKKAAMFIINNPKQSGGERHENSLLCYRGRGKAGL